MALNLFCQKNESTSITEARITNECTKLPRNFVHTIFRGFVKEIFIIWKYIELKNRTGVRAESKKLKNFYSDSKKIFVFTKKWVNFLYFRDHFPEVII